MSSFRPVKRNTFFSEIFGMCGYENATVVRIINKTVFTLITFFFF